MPALLLELLHVFSVFWFVAGLLGRAAAQMQARRSADLRDVDAFLRMSSVFERAMVRPGSLVLLAAGVVTAVLKHWPFVGRPLTWVSTSILLYLSAFILIPLVFIPRGRHFRAAMADARAQGSVTPQLTAALQDRTVAMAHAYEWLMVAAITILMITKPF
ncbi:MAG TPA: DUF2269 family protein [Longimicrobium sp.]|jgi:uncharacterized membrane protein